MFEADQVGAVDPELSGEGLRIALVVSRFNTEISARLLDGAKQTLDELGCADYEVHWVPGAFELPLAAQTLARTGRYDALAVIGSVIRGDTPHFDYVCRAATDGALRVGLETGVPVAFGVLTVDDRAQAMLRAAKPGEPGANKGREFAAVAVEMARYVEARRAHT